MPSRGPKDCIESACMIGYPVGACLSHSSGIVADTLADPLAPVEALCNGVCESPLAIAGGDPILVGCCFAAAE